MNDKSISSPSAEGFFPEAARRAAGGPPPLLVALDIGGTQIKHGLVNTRGELLCTARIDTEGRAGVEAMLARIAGIVRDYAGHHPVGLAVSTLGIIDPHCGSILGAADAVRGYAGCPLKERLQQLCKLPVEVENDVNCVALAEGWRGAALGMHNYIAITLGTGIGGGIVIDQRLYRGRSAAAGEWGCSIIEGEIWEDVASLRGLALLAAQAMPTQRWTARQVFDAREAGDVRAAAVLELWFGRLAVGVANLIYAFNPEGVIIGGGISARGRLFEAEIGALVAARLRPEFRPMCRILVAATGNDAGMLGAARNWLQRQPKELYC